MPLREEIATQYARHGSKHILPFIGSAYDDSTASFRVLALGFNAYVSDNDWPARDVELQNWYPSWWAAAGGSGQTHRFFRGAYKQCTRLANELVSSPLFSGLSYNLEPDNKSALYGTNAIKVFTEEHYKASVALTSEDFRVHAPTWHAELDILAKYQRLPHLIIVFGQAIWDYAWRALNPGYRKFPKYSHLRVSEYVTCRNEDSPCYHYANRITVPTGDTHQNVLLVRAHHPSAQKLAKRDSAWLLAQEDFRELAQLRTLSG